MTKYRLVQMLYLSTKGDEEVEMEAGSGLLYNKCKRGNMKFIYQIQ